jgi:dolichol-phosphate mannosyltransferase
MIHIILPAYNEEAALRPMMEKIARVMAELGATYRVVVVNDGSRDMTGRILREISPLYPIHVITHKYNRGLGETARDGFEFVAETSRSDDVVVRMDCDDTHDPSYIPGMVAKLRDGYEVVTTSRYAPGGGQVGLDWYRRTISRCANLLLKAVFNVPGLKEYTCGYRAYRASLIQDAIAIFGNRFVDLKGLGFTGTIEKLVKCRMLGARIGEVPFVLRYDRKMSSSKVVTSLTTLGYLVLIAKYIYPWGDLGAQWKQQCKERRARVYDENGRLRSPEISLDGEPVEARSAS